MMWRLNWVCARWPTSASHSPPNDGKRSLSVRFGNYGATRASATADVLLAIRTHRAFPQLETCGPEVIEKKSGKCIVDIRAPRTYLLGLTNLLSAFSIKGLETPQSLASRLVQTRARLTATTPKIANTYAIERRDAQGRDPLGGATRIALKPPTAEIARPAAVLW